MSSRGRDFTRKTIAALAGSLLFAQALRAQRFPPFHPSSSAESEAKETNPNEQSQVTIVEGQITDSIGLGLEGVAVEMYQRMPDGSRGRLLAKTETTKLGDFKVTNATPIKEKAIVVFNKKQFAELAREIELGGEEVPFVGETLQGQLELTGTVVSAADDHPLAHATVEIRTPAREWTEHCNDAGEFHVKGLSPGPAELIVSVEGFGREARRILKVDDAGPQRIAMKPQRTVRIVVQDDLGKPIEGTLVEALDSQRNDLRSAVSDAKGAVEFEGFHFDAAMIRIRLSREHYVSDFDFVRGVTLPNDKLEFESVLKMERAGRVTGQVIAENSGKPVYGARVTVGEEISDDSPREFTNMDGRYEIDGIKPGQATVTVHASGFAPQLATAEVRAGDSASVDLTVHPGRTIKGTVKGDDGQPIGNSYVSAESWRGKHSLGIRAMTNESGEFEIDDAPNDEFTVRVMAPGYEDAVIAIAADKSAIPISLKKRLGGGVESPFAAGSLKVGDEVPDVALHDLRGTAISLRALKGKIVVLDFWATWCAPCIAALPDVAKAYSRFKSRDDVVMIGVSRDFDADSAKSFLDAHPEYAWRQVIGAEGGVPDAVEKFRVKFIPALFIIGADGKVAASYLDAADLSAELETLVNKPASASK